MRRHFEEIAKGGPIVLFWYIYDLFLLPLAILIVVIVRILRPLVVIRFGPLYKRRRIGHFALYTELYLCERDAGMHGKQTLDIFYCLKPICNYQLKKMWGRMLYVSPFSRFTYLVDRINRKLPGGSRNIIPIEPTKDKKDPDGFLVRTSAHLFFTIEEERRGRRALNDLGIPEHAPFVCFHSRDSAYLETVFPTHNWPFQDYRNSSIYACLPAAEELTRRGYYAVRMGAVVKEAINTDNPKIIDYASNGARTDFLDIYLSAKCQFFLSSSSGIALVSAVFRRPVIYVNFIPLERVLEWSPAYLFIPKKLWLRRESRFLTFREILDLKIGEPLLLKYRGEKYEQAGLDIIENTAEEITAIAVEMDERLKGTWQTSEEDEALQRRFWSLFKPSEPHRKISSRIGTEFLRNNRELLE